MPPGVPQVFCVTKSQRLAQPRALGAQKTHGGLTVLVQPSVSVPQAEEGSFGQKISELCIGGWEDSKGLK